VVYNQPELSAAITQQIVAVYLGQPACFQLTTVLNYPYDLTSGHLTSTPPGKYITPYSSLLSDDIESCSGTDSCRQRWTACLTLTNGTCNLNGPYSMNFTKECRSSISDCPLLASDKPTNIDFTLESEDFCAEITIDIGLYGSIISYQDSTFTIEETSFIVNREICFLVTVNSDSNTSPYSPATCNILLSETILYSVTVRVDMTIIQLYANGSLLSNSLDTNLKIISVNAGNEVGFCYILSQELITGLNCTGVADIVTGVTVQVSYSDNSGSGKRQASPSGTDSASMSTSSSVDTGNSGNNSGSEIIFSLLILIGILLL